MAELGLFDQVYNPDVLSCLANLSNDEVFTPPEVANAMLDMLPQIGLSVIMGGMIFLIQFLRLSDMATLLIQVPLGALVYIVGSKLLHIDSYEYLKGLIKSYTKK